jgi:hypothetical protein
MASTPTSVDLLSMFSLLNNLASKLDSMDERLARIEDPAGSTIAATHAEETAKVPPFRSAKATKGKGRAQAPQAPSKAKPAKKERATPKAANLPNPVPLRLAQTFPMEGKTDRHLVTVVIPDASAQHVIGQAGKGLKQIHDISGARVRAYSAGSGDERHVSIRGTDIQIGDALVVLGKRLARKKVRPPKTKKSGPTVDSSQPAPLTPTQQSLAPAAAPYVSTQRYGPSTEPRIVEVPTEERDESPATAYAPTVAMASPLPSSTPNVPSVTMGSPDSYTPDDALTPMQIDAIRQRQTRIDAQIAHARASGLLGQPSTSSRGGNTARRSRPSQPGNRGRW